jgi:uncharacterized protein (UPF0297 family)
MNNYNRFSNQLKVVLVNFSKKISKNVGKVEMKFITDMIFGIVKSNSIMLSNIARGLNENIKLKDTVDRLSKNLEHLQDKLDIIWNNYYDTLSVNENTIINIDNSDIIKPKGEKFEDLNYIKDGSNEHKTEKGYYVCEMVMLDNDRPISLYSKVFSTITKGFKSLNDETFKGLNQIFKTFGNIGTCVMDRGYDSNNIIKYFISKKWKFIIRGKENRNVIYKNKTFNIVELANKFKGKISVKLFLKGKRVVNRKCGHIKVKLPTLNKYVNVVFVYFNHDITIFYTNREINCKKDLIYIVNSYYKRWRVEEYFKFKKQQFDFENIRVRSLNKINSLNTLLSLAISSIESITRNNSKLLNFIYQISKSIKKVIFFDLYRITSGIFSLLSHTISGVRYLLHIKKRDNQISFFDFCPNFTET